ncbi:uncharacterized protein M6B38_116855 [Iris pallida]|uniref:Uncharacterized protein n=1 Tax=Iris pallida TaxID=29817 RepID=A0AAX6HTT0_IRIPA|nr:uncharacterized protein M6B38_116855 [Iris pallida]
MKQKFMQIGAQQQTRQRTSPFSLQSGHRLKPPATLSSSSSSATNTLQLPEQTSQGTNLMSPHASQHTPPAAFASAASHSSRAAASSPSSCIRLTSSAPPRYLPLANALGRLPPNPAPRISRSSSLKPQCIDTSLSSTLTP